MTNEHHGLSTIEGTRTDADANFSVGSQAIADRVFEMLGVSESFLDSPSPSDTKAEDAEGEAPGPWVLCIEDDRDFSLALKR